MAWTEITRLQCRQKGLRYVSDMTNNEWALIVPFMAKPNRLGRPRKTQLRAVVSALLYMASTGFQWRALPKEFPPASTEKSGNEIRVRVKIDFWLCPFSKVTAA